MTDEKSQVSMLYIFRKDDASVDEARQLATSKGCKWFLSFAPKACRLGALAAVSGAEEFADAWEVRFFGEAGEVRWVLGAGAVLLADLPNGGPGDGWKNEEHEVWVDPEERSYLLLPWVQPPAADAPAVEAPAAGQHLHAKEYLYVCDDFGNVAVLTERLVGISP